MGSSSGTSDLRPGPFSNLILMPPRARLGEAGIELSTTELALLLTGIDLASARRRKRYARAV